VQIIYRGCWEGVLSVAACLVHGVVWALWPSGWLLLKGLKNAVQGCMGVQAACGLAELAARLTGVVACAARRQAVQMQGGWGHMHACKWSGWSMKGSPCSPVLQYASTVLATGCDRCLMAVAGGQVDRVQRCVGHLACMCTCALPVACMCTCALPVACMCTCALPVACMCTCALPVACTAALLLGVCAALKQLQWIVHRHLVCGRQLSAAERLPCMCDCRHSSC
jgi:hypothetical protein